MTVVKPKHMPPRGKHLLPRLTRAEGFTVHPFDLQHGVQTSGLIPGRLLKTGHAHDRHSTAYFGVAPSVFHSLIKRWLRTRPYAPLNEFVFIDIGAGMGRAMLLASEFPFKRVEGIELNPALAAVARSNIREWRSAGRAVAPMRISCRDVLQCSFPNGPCLAFLFNPFGESVMRRLLKRLAGKYAGHPGQLDLLYVNNEQDHIIEQHTGFSRLFLGQVLRSRSDAIADHKIMANQPDGEYAAANHEDCSIWRFSPMQNPR